MGTLDWKRALDNLELGRQYAPRHDPEKSPPKQPGDKYILIPTIFGMIAGGVLGVFASRFLGFIAFNMFIGVMVCGGLGLGIGCVIRKIVEK